MIQTKHPNSVAVIIIVFRSKVKVAKSPMTFAVDTRERTQNSLTVSPRKITLSGYNRQNWHILYSTNNHTFFTTTVWMLLNRISPLWKTTSSQSESTSSYFSSPLFLQTQPRVYLPFIQRSTKVFSLGSMNLL